VGLHPTLPKTGRRKVEEIQTIRYEARAAAEVDLPMSEPRVSVVIPTYNRADLLPATLASVAAQEFGDLEVIVVDDGSEDDTREVVRRHGGPGVRYLGLGRAGNLSVVRNAGIEAATGEYVAFLDSDDLWDPDKLALQVGLLDSRPDAGFSLCGYRTFDASGPLSEDRYAALGPGGDDASVGDIFDPLIRARIVIYSSTVVIRGSALEGAGRLNPGLVTGDYELFTRLARRYPCATVHRPLAGIRKHEGNTSRRLGAEGLIEAIYSLERCRAAGEISRRDYAEMTLIFRSQLGAMLSERGEARAALREYSCCVRASPASWKAWLLFAATLPRCGKAR
jgi:glycosyltransferase involved in cell wall biosynthesis